MGFFNFSLLGEIIQYAFGSFIFGIILTLLFVFLLFFLIRGFYPKSTFKPLSLITGIVLVFLLIPQMIQLCGAVALKSKCDDIVVWLDDNIIHSWSYEYPREIAVEESTVIVDELINHYPIVSSFVGSGWFEGYDTSNICEGIVDTLNSFLNKFIWKSIGWSLFFVSIASFIVVQSIKRGNRISRDYLDTMNVNSSIEDIAGDNFDSDYPYSSGNNSGAF